MNQFNPTLSPIRRRFTWLFFVCAMFLMFALSAKAQTTTGSIYGTVTDTDGASVPEATVSNGERGETNESTAVMTNDSGAFVFPVVSPGTYKVTASRAGFSSLTQIDLRVASNQNVNASFRAACRCREQRRDGGGGSHANRYP